MGIYRSCLKRGLSTIAITKRAQQIGIEIKEATMEEEAAAEIKRLKEEVRDIYSQNEARRDEELLESANIAEDIGEKKKAKRLRQLCNIKHKIQVFKHLDFQQGKDMRSSGIDRLEVPKSWPTMEEYDENKKYDLEDPKSVKTDDEWMTVTCTKTIEYYLKLQNRRHFGQAEMEGTSFTSTAMKEKFDWEAATYQAELVLKGE